jgi:transcriptional regulator with XRE-family HTH domain
MNADDKVAERIAKNIKRFRKEWDISASQLAAIMGAPANTVQSYERGDRGALRAIYRIADAFGRPADHLRMDDPPGPVEPHPPAFGLVPIAKEVDEDLVERARLAIADINREHRARERKRARPPKTRAERLAHGRKLQDDEARALEDARRARHASSGRAKPHPRSS